MLFDDVLRQVGEFGPYQIVLYCLLGIVGVPAGYQSVGVAFLAMHIDHWCDVPALKNLTSEQQKSIAIPYDADRQQYSECFMYDFDYDSYSQDDLLRWNLTERLTNNSVLQVACRAWSFDTSLYNSVVNKWSLVCDRAYLTSLLQTAYMAGYLVGCLLYGQVSDRFGRKKAAMVAITVNFVVGILHVFVPTYELYAIARFLMGTSTAGGFTCIFVMVMEMVGPRWRMEAGVMIQAWFAGGIILLSVVAWLLSDLVKLHLFMALFMLMFIPYAWIIPESPRWLITQGRHEEATAIVHTIAKYNKRAITDKLELVDEDESEHHHHKGLITDLFKGKKICMISLILFLCWFVVSMDYYGLSLSVNILPGGVFINMFVSGLIELPSYAVAAVCLNKIGRKWPNAGCYLLCGICVILMTPFLDNKDLQYMLTLMSLSGKFFCSAAFAIVYVYSAELFPTVVRNVGIGSASMCARIAGLLQPQISLLGHMWKPLPYLVYGGVSMVAAIVSIFLPETLNRQLPESLEDVENFHRLPKKVLEQSESGDSMIYKPKNGVALERV